MIPQFEKELNACTPPINGFGYAGVLALARTPSGGYIFAMATNSGPEIAVFDAGMYLISEAPASLTPIAFADPNGDGNQDMIAATYFSNAEWLAIALGTGGAGFQPPVLYLFVGPVGSIGGIAVADVNGDHKPDIVVAFDMGDSGYISVLLGNGDRTFQPEKIVSQSPALLTAVGSPI